MKSFSMGTTIFILTAAMLMISTSKVFSADEWVLSKIETRTDVNGSEHIYPGKIISYDNQGRVLITVEKIIKHGFTYTHTQEYRYVAGGYVMDEVFLWEYHNSEQTIQNKKTSYFEYFENSCGNETSLLVNQVVKNNIGTPEQETHIHKFEYSLVDKKPYDYICESRVELKNISEAIENKIDDFSCFVDSIF
jgi:hypothetical protein